jgi:hypothetical protein
MRFRPRPVRILDLAEARALTVSSLQQAQPIPCSGALRRKFYALSWIDFVEILAS